MKNRQATAAATPAAPQVPTRSATRTPPAKPKKRHPRPGVLMRGALTEAYDLRGNSRGKLWLQYSAHARKDMAFTTELAYTHFLYTESSFDVTQVNYAPADEVTRAVGAAFVDYVDVKLVLANGETVWRHIGADEPSQSDQDRLRELMLVLHTVKMPDGALTPRLQTITPRQIVESEHRIRNWHRIASWLAAARYWNLHDHELAVAALLRRRGRVEFQDVLALGEGGEHSGLYGAALFKQLQRGAYRSNLFDATFTLRSTFSELQEAS
ncbi:hypothetical protein LXT12_20570 [Pelomonas sp. P7]|uniref:Uncharacterized protein n=1 Tax=Pelomonas caseinilytica TaxID=2906763 RepID=A0ABS8XK54_9BURK|nr:hypothetical protein [Pelomonas sp. P7]MCE4539650.1 hypothetical protein [Pelomonas sp. P7]